MRQLPATVVALLLTVPFACAHDERDPESPADRVPGSAGNEVGRPAPAITNEPVVPGVPNASTGLPSVANAGPGATFEDSRTTIKPGAIAQVGAGAGGTIGTGGTGLGGIGTGGSFTGGLGTGGSPIR